MEARVRGQRLGVRARAGGQANGRGREIQIPVRLCNLTTYAFKGHVKIVKIDMVKFNVSILNRLKIMSFLYIKI